MPIQWPRKLNFQHKIIEKKLFLCPSPLPFLINIQKKRRNSIRALCLEFRAAEEGKTGVKTFILQRVQPPSPPPPQRAQSPASLFLTFPANTRWNTRCPQRLRPFGIQQTVFTPEPVHHFRSL